MQIDGSKYRAAPPPLRIDSRISWRSLRISKNPGSSLKIPFKSLQHNKNKSTKKISPDVLKNPKRERERQRETERETTTTKKTFGKFFKISKNRYKYPRTLKEPLLSPTWRKKNGNRIPETFQLRPKMNVTSRSINESSDVCFRIGFWHSFHSLIPS